MVTGAKTVFFISKQDFVWRFMHAKKPAESRNMSRIVVNIYLL